MNTQMYDDDELERMVRAGLAHHARNAPTELSGEVPGVRNGTESAGGAWSGGPGRGRGGRNWLLPAAAAALVLAIPVGYQIARDAGSKPPTTVADGPTSSKPSHSTSEGAGASSSTSAESHRTAATGAQPDGIPADWRVESYGGVQLWVPPTWGWGGAPFEPSWSKGEILDCSGGRAFTVPGSSAYEFVDEATPYVGRPVMMTDACVSGGDTHPRVDAVWFDAAGVEVGEQTYADGVVRESRIVGDVVVTVFSRDAALRAQILGSARASAVDANGCPSKPSGQAADSAWRRGSNPSSLSVCAYDSGRLLWSGQVGAEQAAAYAAAAGPGTRGAHSDTPIDWVGEHDELYLGLRSLGAADDDRVRWDRYSATTGILSPDGKKAVMTPASVANTAPWATDSGGVKAYVVGGGVNLDPSLQRYFRGILG